MPQIEKHIQLIHPSRTSPGPQYSFSAVPTEAVSFPVDPTPELGSGLTYERDFQTEGSFEDAPWSTPRNDLRLISANFNGLGWTFQHELKGKGFDDSQFKKNRSLLTEIHELVDGGDGVWRNISGGSVARSFIYDVQHKKGNNGENSLIILSATPDYFYANIQLPTMSYGLGSVFNEAEYDWWYLCFYGWDWKNPPSVLPATPDEKRAMQQNTAGYPFTGQGSGGIADDGYHSSIGGAFLYQDDYVLTAGAAAAPRAVNRNHLMQFVSSSRVMVELMKNHIFCNGRPMAEVFTTELYTALDIERDLVTYDVSGTVNSIFQELGSQYFARVWWDSMSRFHFIPDYYAGGEIPIKAFLDDGPSMIGELTVSPGTDHQRVSRVSVKQHMLANFGDSDVGPLENIKLGAVYPPGAPAYGEGEAIFIDNYMGKNAGTHAARNYNKAVAQTTLQWSNFPYPTLLFDMVGKVISVTASDPRGGWNFTDKKFVVESGSLQLQDPDRPGHSVYLCSINAIELEA